MLHVRSLFAVLALLSTHAVSFAQVAAPKPEAFGFSALRLKNLHAAMQREIDEKTLAGITTLLMRHGAVVDEHSYGVRDIAAGKPMTNDTIFRIYSMTKPVTGVAMMILYEEGRWHPTDPVSKFIPEFANLRVFKGVGPDGKIITEAPAHAPTMAELMTHTAGFTYGLFGDSPVDKLYTSSAVLAAPDLHEMVRRIAAIPLLYQPGTKWVYSVSMDIQGYIVEKLSGKSLPDFMEERIFRPLKMTDTGFFVPKEKQSRFATLYGGGPKGELVPADGPVDRGYATQPTAASGGGGLVSTTRDYSRFAQMLLNHGTLDGQRILAPATVDLMTANHLAPKLLTGEFSIGKTVMRPGLGWGYDFAVFNDPLTADEVVGKGTYYWEGAADTWFWIDPTNDLIFIGMTQRMYGNGQPPMAFRSRGPVYGALVDPKK